jgi:uncharacterized damage-inducible protein DinB
MDDLRYPIGKFKQPEKISSDLRKKYIKELEEAPSQLRNAVNGLSEAELNTQYRKGGWTIRQVVHHIADGHMNYYIRFKLAATDDEPTIVTYNEARWADLFDGKNADINLSLSLLDVLHKRWIMFLNSLDESQFAKSFRHPDLGLISIDQALALYVWHVQHHIAHITTWRKKNK